MIGNATTILSASPSLKWNYLSFSIPSLMIVVIAWAD